MVPGIEPDKESGMPLIEMTIQELFRYMEEHEHGDFLLHVDFSEGVSDES